MDEAGDNSQKPDEQKPPAAGPMDDLPVEWIGQILHLLPLRDVFRSMRVNKYWEYAARYELKNRKHLSIRRLAQCWHCMRNSKACSNCRKRRFSDVGQTVGIDDTDDDKVIQCLMQMRGLNVIRVVHQQSKAPKVYRTFPITQIISHFREQLRVIRGIRQLPLIPGFLYPALIELHCNHMDQEDAAACPQLRNLSLTDTDMGSGVIPVYDRLREVALTKLRRLTMRAKRWSGADFSGLIVKHAPQLTHLDINFSVPTKLKGQEVVYEQLVSLTTECRSTFPTCPRLQSLIVHMSASPSVLNQLPVQTMRCLTLILPDTRIKDADATHLLSAVKVISRLQNLTDLRLISNCNKTKFSVEDDHMIQHMFDHLKKLKLVEITFGDGFVHDLDPMVQKMVQNNPGLKDVTLNHMFLSDASIQVLSHLKNLQSLALDLEIGETRSVTTEGLMNLMRAESGNSLLHLSLKNAKHINMERMGEAFKLMLKDRNLGASRNDWTIDPDSCILCSDSFSPQVFDVSSFSFLSNARIHHFPLLRLPFPMAGNGGGQMMF